MLSDFAGADKVYIACGYTDLRRGIDGLASMVQEAFDLDPFTNTLFLFCSRHRDRIKALYWEGMDLFFCRETMTEIGTKVVRTLEIIPARTVVKEHIYYTYACQKCSKEGTETPVVKAPREKNIIPGSFSTPEAVAHIIPQGTFSCC